MPLTLCEKGNEYFIKKIGGSCDVKKHLTDLGFVLGGDVCVLNKLNGNLIVKIKDSRVALDKNLANKILV